MDSNFSNFDFVCGIDEAGRGPLAGPVVAAAVILAKNFPHEILCDSKKLSEKKRLYCEKIIKQKSFWGLGVVNQKKIDEINILRASLLAMEKAFENLILRIQIFAKKSGEDFDRQKITAIVDGKFAPKIFAPVHCEVKADSKFFPVMAASIIAKTCRDKIMLSFDKIFPEYGYAQHKGYPTKFHKEICRKIGPSKIQRQTFKF